MENPFADPSVVEAQRAAANAPIEEDNPFAEDVAPQPAAVSMPPSGQITGQMTPAPVTPSAGHSTAAAPIKNIESIPGHADLLKRQQELERKEAELERRERQMNAGGGNVQPNNWPPLPAWFPIKPCFYHDISLEIPLDFQKVVRYLYYLWMVYCASLAINVLGNMTFWIVASKQAEESEAKTNAPKDFALSILWLGLFSPCSMCWYIPAYRAFKTDSSFNFFIFFFIFFFQICWLLLMTIGVPGMGYCGWSRAINALSTPGGLAGGIISMISAVMFTITLVFAVVMLRKVHQIYGATGATFAKAMNEGQSTIGSTLWTNEHVRNAAQSAATQAAQHTVNNTFK